LASHLINWSVANRSEFWPFTLTWGQTGSHWVSPIAFLVLDYPKDPDFIATKKNFEILTHFWPGVKGQGVSGHPKVPYSLADKIRKCLSYCSSKSVQPFRRSRKTDTFLVKFVDWLRFGKVQFSRLILIAETWFWAWSIPDELDYKTFRKNVQLMVTCSGYKC